MKLVIPVMTAGPVAWGWGIRGFCIMRKGTHRFTKKFLRQNGLKVLSDNAQSFIFDSSNVFAWEITSNTLFGYWAEPLSRLPYKKKTFQNPYDHFDSEFFQRQTLILNISHFCTMECVYCCAGGGSYNSPRMNMPLETACRAIDWLRKTKRLTIILFGGEPMCNPDVATEIVRYAIDMGSLRGMEVDFNLNTNGTISLKQFPKLIDLILQSNFEVIVSIDGAAEVQNKNRPLIGRQSSYSIVSKNLVELLKLLGPEKVTAKVTMQWDVRYISSLIDPLLELGVRKVLATPIVKSTNFCENEVNFTHDEYNLMLERDRIFLNWYIDRLIYDPDLRIQPYHKLLSVLYQSLSISQYCLAGIRIFCVYPNGDVYPCHRFSGESEIMLGNLNNDNEIKTFNSQLPVGRYSACEKCFTKHICWGNRCLQQNRVRGQSLFGVNDPLSCVYQKNNLKLLLSAISRVPSKNRERSFAIRPQ